jgi:hypothetical protein
LAALNHKRIKLDFNFSDPVDSSGEFHCSAKENPSSTAIVSWAATTRGLCAYPNKVSSIDINRTNEICIQYKDIAGNQYFTQEDEDLSPNSNSGTCSD